MSDTPFSPEARRALDSFAPPPLRADFADRVIARIEGRSEAAALPRSRARWLPANPWKRGGMIVGAVASLGLVSAAAAATGMFGDPVFVPVISHIAETLDLAPRPIASADEGSSRPLAARPTDSTPINAAAHERFAQLADDPEFRALPPPQKRAEVRRTARELVQSGDATPREVVAAARDAARERLAEMTPEERAQLSQAAAERREAMAGLTPQERRQVLRERRQERAETLGQPSPSPANEEPAEPPQ